jgi:hypothetical protein
MERYTHASAVLALTEVHLHVTILVDEYQKKNYNMYQWYQEVNTLPILGWKIEYITSLLLLAKQMIQECNKTLQPMENILSNPFKHNCAIQSDRNTVSNVRLMNLLQGSSSALNKLHQIIQPVFQPASKSTSKSSESQ